MSDQVRSLKDRISLTTRLIYKYGTVCFVFISGSKSSVINMEARPLDAKMVTRRCIVTRLKEMTGAKYRELTEQKAGGLLILLPMNLSSLQAEEKQVCLVRIE